MAISENTTPMPRRRSRRPTKRPTTRVSDPAPTVPPGHKITGSILVPAALRESIPERDLYCVGVHGKCLEPLIFDGDKILCSASRPLEAGSLVAIWWCDPEQEPKVKRLILPPPLNWQNMITPGSTAVPSAFVDCLNPPTTYGISMDKVSAMHMVVLILAGPDYEHARELRPTSPVDQFLLHAAGVQ